MQRDFLPAAVAERMERRTERGSGGTQGPGRTGSASDHAGLGLGALINGRDSRSGRGGEGGDCVIAVSSGLSGVGTGGLSDVSASDVSEDGEDSALWDSWKRTTGGRSVFAGMAIVTRTHPRSTHGSQAR